MWTVAAANKTFQGPLGSYNGLTDIHLAHYFSSPAKMSHLRKANLITADGIIIPEQTYKVETMKYEKKKHLYDFLAKNIIQNAALEESSWNKKLYSYLEDISKMEVVENTKVERKKLGSNLSLSLNKMKATIAPVHCHSNTKSTFKKSNICQLPRSALSSAEFLRKNGSFPQSNVSKLKRCYSAKNSSPYTFPMFWCNNNKNQVPLSVLNGVNFIKRKKRKQVQLCSDSEQKSLNCTKKVSSTLKNNRLDHCKITLFYYGHGAVNFQSSFRKEIVVKQQHSGGTSVTVFKGDIAPNEAIAFTSLTHEGFPFSLTIFLNGIRDLKLSSCCVFRYTLKKRLGGSSGNFSIENIDGGKKCLKCQYLEVEACSKSFRKESIVSENMSTVEPGPATQKENIDEEFVSSKEVIHGVENSSSQSDDSNTSIKSEASIKYDEDIEENLSVKSDLQHSKSETQISEEHHVEKTDIDVVGESYSDSESSIVSFEEHDNLEQENYKANNYQSENSSDDENGKEHVILAAVHNLP